MSRMIGTVSRGVRAPIIRNGDDIVEIVTASVLEAAADELDARLDTVRERAVTLIMQSREEAEADIEVMREGAREKMREAVKHIEWELTDI